MSSRNTSQEALHGGVDRSADTTGIAGCNVDPCPPGKACSSGYFHFIVPKQLSIINNQKLTSNFQLTAPIQSGHYGEAAPFHAEKGLG